MTDTVISRFGSVRLRCRFHGLCEISSLLNINIIPGRKDGGRKKENSRFAFGPHRELFRIPEDTEIVVCAPLCSCARIRVGSLMLARFRQNVFVREYITTSATFCFRFVSCISLCECHYLSLLIRLLDSCFSTSAVARSSRIPEILSLSFQTQSQCLIHLIDIKKKMLF